VSDRLTMLVMVGVRTGAHTLRSQVGIGSESDCSLGQLKKEVHNTRFILIFRSELLKRDDSVPTLSTAQLWPQRAKSTSNAHRPTCLCCTSD